MPCQHDITTTVTNSTGVEPVSHIHIIKPTCCQNNPAESFLWIHLHQFQYLYYLKLGFGWKRFCLVGELETGACDARIGCERYSDVTGKNSQVEFFWTRSTPLHPHARWGDCDPVPGAMVVDFYIVPFQDQPDSLKDKTTVTTPWHKTDSPRSRKIFSSGPIH